MQRTIDRLMPVFEDYISTSQGTVSASVDGLHEQIALVLNNQMQLLQNQMVIMLKLEQLSSQQDRALENQKHMTDGLVVMEAQVEQLFAQIDESDESDEDQVLPGGLYSSDATPSAELSVEVRAAPDFEDSL